ncbi:hypothetical protein CYLTODRAFT_234745 [Cylindrobasidium torrendii FP15055 ss-10]|uniref:Uncharacterized protein n=1 Tax=Cylindrobasidium torrendii FP15055 ss-10 TaxID=1314674 RepID=A0A0D7ASQ5_9AGAR|nr:hypothetical protein CYLTODRAFT_234745 [Cylindrobasidium torrendii FP15055 ss-10]
MRLYLLDGSHVANQAFTDHTGRIIYTTSTTKGVTTISRASQMPPPKSSNDTAPARTQSQLSSSNSPASNYIRRGRTSDGTAPPQFYINPSPNPPTQCLSPPKTKTNARPITPKARPSTGTKNLLPRPPTPPASDESKSKLDSHSTVLLSPHFTHAHDYSPPATPTKSSFLSAGGGGAEDGIGAASRNDLNQNQNSISTLTTLRTPRLGLSGCAPAAIAHTQTHTIASLTWARTPKTPSSATSSWSEENASSTKARSPYTTLRMAGREVRAMDVWRAKGNGTKKSSFKREWVAEDGRVYVWDVKWWKPRVRVPSYPSLCFNGEC